jgi:hypothetical protein
MIWIRKELLSALTIAILFGTALLGVAACARVSRPPSTEVELTASDAPRLLSDVARSWPGDAALITSATRFGKPIPEYRVTGPRDLKDAAQSVQRATYLRIPILTAGKTVGDVTLERVGGRWSVETVRASSYHFLHRSEAMRTMRTAVGSETQVKDLLGPNWSALAATTGGRRGVVFYDVLRAGDLDISLDRGGGGLAYWAPAEFEFMTWTDVSRSAR